MAGISILKFARVGLAVDRCANDSGRWRGKERNSSMLCNADITHVAKHDLAEHIENRRYDRKFFRVAKVSSQTFYTIVTCMTNWLYKYIEFRLAVPVRRRVW